MILRILFFEAADSLERLVQHNKYKSTDIMIGLFLSAENKLEDILKILFENVSTSNIYRKIFYR